MRFHPPSGNFAAAPLMARFLAAWQAALLLVWSCAPPPPPPGPAGPAAGESIPAALVSLPADHLVDLSHPFNEKTIYWPTAAPFRLRQDARGKTAAGYWYASNSLCASEHGGTHLDAPYHFAENGWTTERIPLKSLVAAAVVIDVRAACAADPDHAATPEEIRAFEGRHGAIPDGAVVILWTGWGERWPDRKRYLGDDSPGDASRLRFPGFSADAARYLTTTRHVVGVGIDTASLDPGNSRDFPAHQVFNGANVYGLENLDNVERLPPTGAALIALPMKIEGGTGGPTRVVAILP